MENNFIIGSEWLYYNIYIGPKTADNFLLDYLQPLVEKFKKEYIIDKWFYIRYKDDNDLHLRIRFHSFNTDNIAIIISEMYILLQPLLINSYVSKVIIDTYQREIDRYGYGTIEQTESIFFANSELIINLIKNGGDNRWLLGMKSIDFLLDLFNYNLQKKLDLLDSLKTNFGNEFGVNKHIRKQLSIKYRTSKALIDDVFNNTDNNVISFLEQFKKDAIEPIKYITNNTKLLSSRLNDYMASIIHMHNNRLFQSNQRMNEWVLYDLLHQYYKNKFGREKYNKKK